MRKIVLGISLLCSGWVFSQVATAWSHLEKKGEYRRNPTTGNIEYYEYNTPSRRNSYAEELARSQRETANSVRMLGEALAVRAQLDAQREREEYEYYSNLYEKSNRLKSEANKAFNDKKYATAGNKYVEAYNVIVNIPRRYNVEGDKAYLYASWLESMYYNKEYARFLEKYNYDKIKYSTDKELNKKLREFYNSIIEENRRIEKERERIERERIERIERERREKERLKEEKIKEEYNKNFGRTYKGEIEVYEYTPLYEQPDMSSKEVYQILDGKVLVLEKVSNGKYYKVSTNGKIGYIFTGFIKK